jgi:hypothetical protein
MPENPIWSPGKRMSDELVLGAFIPLELVNKTKNFNLMVGLENFL